MLTTLSPDKISSLIGMLASEHDGEVLAAAKMLVKMAKSHKLNINEFLTAKSSASQKERSKNPNPNPQDVWQRGTWGQMSASWAESNWRDQGTSRIKPHVQIVRKIVAKCAGSTILSDRDTEFMGGLLSKVNISAAEAQALAALARRVGA